MGLVNLNWTSGSVSGLSMTLLMFCVNILHFFVFTVLWRAIFWNQCYQNTDTYLQLTIVNTQPKTYHDPSTDTPCQVSYTRATLCAISLNLTLLSMIPRLNLQELMVMSLSGSFFYCLHEEILILMSAFDVYDVGSGFRVFAFGSSMATLCLLWNAEYTLRYDSKEEMFYSTRAFGLLGILFIFITFPLIYVAGLYRFEGAEYGANPATIFIAIFNVVMGLASGVLGSVAISCIMYQKLHIVLIINCALSVQMRVT